MVAVYNHELLLIGYVIAEDEIGNEIKNPVERSVLCKVKDIGSTEFYNAQVNNLRPEIKFVIHSFEYLGESEVAFKGIRYKVIRSYQGDTVDRGNNALSGEEIELTCEKVLGNA